MHDETREKPQQYVQDIMKIIGSENNIKAIDVAHRKMSGSIITRFKTCTQCDEVYIKRFAIKGITSCDLGFQIPAKGNTIFINESLTSERSKLMVEVRWKLKYLNEGRDKEIKLRSKSSENVYV